MHARRRAGQANTFLAAKRPRLNLLHPFVIGKGRLGRDIRRARRWHRRGERCRYWDALGVWLTWTESRWRYRQSDTYVKFVWPPIRSLRQLRLNNQCI